MIIIYNKIIPFKGFKAINLFGILFVREECKGRITPVTINHESIHTEQMKELLFIPFYLIYFLEWLFKVIFVYPFSHKAYKNISFEKEAFGNEENFDYLKTRKHYAMWRKKKA